MGRHRSGNRGAGAKAREDAVVEEVQVAQQLAQKQAILRDKPDDALFVIDSRGSGRKRRKLQKEAKVEREPSKNEVKLIQKKYLEKAKKQQLETATSSAGRVASVSVKQQNIYDAWGEEKEEEKGSKDGKPITKPAGGRKRPKSCIPDTRPEICQPGQSYNPTEEDHDDVLAQAVAVELRREEAVKDEAEPISKGLSASTLALLKGDENSSGESDEEEGGEGGEAGTRQGSGMDVRKEKGKLTRTQRNKQRRAREAASKVLKKQTRKEMLKMIGRADELVKEVESEEVIQEERRLALKALRDQKRRRKEAYGGGRGLDVMAGLKTNKQVIEAPSVPVNLGEELHGSMRLMKSQGSVLLDKVSKLRESKIHPETKVARRKQKKGAFTKKAKYVDRYKG